MNKYASKLELNHIIDQLVSFCVMEDTKNEASEIEPINDLEQLNQLLDEADEALRIVLRYDRAPIHLSKPYEKAVRLASKGGLLDPSELYETARLYQTIKANLHFLQILTKEEIPCLNFEGWINSCYVNEYLDGLLVKSVDEAGNVLDNATPTLSSLRKRINQIDIRIKNKLQELLAKEASKLSQPTISMRDGHYVIPVKIEYKNSVKGNLLDTSGSGQTVYIEPLPIMELNSQKQTLLADERIEVEKILRNLSNLVGSEAEILLANYQIIKKIDFTFAKAMLAKAQNASRPSINNEHILNLVDARHPLLKVKKVIPNNISFDKYLGIVITGPNTGGKTVLLKTVGLLVLMTKCGLLIPATKDSNVMIYDKVCCDIGDEQSILENLSTFSGHMSNIVDIINTITPNSLVLFDEIGGGTDPSEGSSLAISILEYLINQKISFITTTHYPELKSFAYSSDKIVNASMEFDQNTLNPTYHLQLGVPGSSNAFEIAKNLGLNQAIIDEAKKRTAQADSDAAALIKKLELSNHELALKIKENNELIEQNAAHQKELNSKLALIEQEKNRILKNAQKKADEEVAKIKQDAIKILNDIKDNQNNNLKLHEVIALKKELASLDAEIEEKPSKTKYEPITKELKVGDDVYVKDYDQHGVISKIMKDGTYLVSFGNVNMRLNIEDLALSKETSKKSEDANFVRTVSKSTISLRLNLIGMRYEEARDQLEKYFDDCMLCGIKQFTIIHGYGTGALRGLVQDYLKKHPQVAEFRYGGAGEGGMGATVVTLK